MAEEKVKLTFEGDTANLVEKIKAIPGVTEKEAQLMAAAMEKGFRKAEKAAGQAAEKLRKETEKASTAAKKAAEAATAKLAADLKKKSADQLQSIKENAINVFGGVVRDAEDLYGALTLVGPAAVGAGAGLAAIGGSLVLMAGAVGVMAELGKFVHAASKETEKLAPQLEAIAGTPIVSPESIDAAREYHKQIALLAMTSKGFAQILVDEVAPAMSDTAAIASGASIEMLKFAKSIQESEDQIFEAHPAFAAFIKEFNATAIFGSAGANFLELANTVGVATGAFDKLEAEGRAAAIVAEAQARSAKAVDEAHKKAAGDGLKGYESKLKDVEKASDEAAKAEMEHAKEVAQAEQELLDSRGQAWLQYAQDQKAATDQQVQQQLDALALWDAAVQQVQEDTAEATKSFQDLQKQGTEEMKAVVEAFAAEAFAFADQLAAQAQAHHEDEIDRLDALMAKRKENLKKALENGNKERAAEIQGRIDADKAAREIEKKAAKRAYAVQQAIAITQIAISTAQATMALLASPAIAALGPGAPPAAAALAIATGAIQAAAVLAAPAPKFHAGKAPDEMPATVTRKEAVLNERATSRLGRDNINALNSGAPVGGGNIQLYASFDGRHADKITTTALRSGKRTGMALKQRKDPLGAGHYGRRR